MHIGHNMNVFSMNKLILWLGHCARMHTTTKPQIIVEEVPYKTESHVETILANVLRRELLRQLFPAS